MFLLFNEEELWKDRKWFSAAIDANVTKFKLLFMPPEQSTAYEQDSIIKSFNGAKALTLLNGQSITYSFDLNEFTTLFTACAWIYNKADSYNIQTIFSFMKDLSEHIVFRINNRYLELDSSMFTSKADSEHVPLGKFTKT